MATMIRYTGKEALRIEDEQGRLEAYFSPGAVLAIHDNNQHVLEMARARPGDFEVVGNGTELEAGPPSPADGAGFGG